MRDFSHADKRKAAAQDNKAAVEGHENKKRLDPAVFNVNTSVYFLAGRVADAGTVTDPST